MNYEEACDYLTTLDKLGSVPGLSAITKLLERLGNPQDHTRFVHISGTNGKGSVGSFISSILMDAGYRVGRYVSPAVWSPLEIIELGGRYISSGEFAKIISMLRPVCDKMYAETGIHPTRFEIETAAAFVFFDWNKCDIAVIECGMGGLLDATNVISSVDCAVITSISPDHMSFLGDTVEKIAGHKAGIIKPGADAVCIDDPVTRPVIEQYGMAHGMEGFSAVNPKDIRILKASVDEGVLFDYKGYKKLRIKLAGTYQAQNAALAVEAWELLGKRYRLTEENMRNGLMNAGWNGRFQLIGTKPYFVIDGAHNDDGAKALSECIDTYFPGRTVTFIIGVFADKEYDKILKRLMKYAKRVITIETPQNPRALSSKKLAEYIKKYYDISVYNFDAIGAAVAAALDVSNPEDVIIACGSLSHLKEITDRYAELKGGQHDR